MNKLVFEEEYVEDLQRNGLRIIQPREGYRFSADSVILAHFAGASSLKGTVVDLGTGGGVMLLLLSALCPGLNLVGLELQERAADRARRSVELNKSVLQRLGAAVEIIQGDLRDAASYIKPGCADAVISNPPFISIGAGPVNCNREIALSRQELTCTLEDVFKAAGCVLKNKGRLFLVHKPSRLTDLSCLGRHFSLEPKTLRFVHPRLDSEPSMVLLECIKGSAPGARVMPPLVMFDAEGGPSQEIKTIYGAEA